MQAQKKSFKQTHTKQKRIKMFEQAQQKDKDTIIIVVEKDPKCKVFPTLKHCRFLIKKKSKFFEIHDAIRKRILQFGGKYQNYSLFLFTPRILPVTETSVQEIWLTQQDPQDKILYLKYSDMNPFGNDDL